MNHTTTFAIILGNYFLFYLLFGYQRAIKKLGVGNDLKALLFPNWYYVLFVVKVLSFIVLSIYFILHGHWLYIISYLSGSIALNAVLPIPYSFYKQLIIKNARKNMYHNFKLVELVRLIEEK